MKLSETNFLESLEMSSRTIISTEFSEMSMSEIRAMERITGPGCLVVDLKSKTIVHISNRLKNLCGINDAALEFKNRFYKDYLDIESYKFLSDVISDSMDILDTFSMSEKIGFVMIAGVKLKTKNGYIPMVHKMTPVKIDAKGSISVVVCSLATISNYTVGDAQLWNHDIDRSYIYKYNKRSWYSESTMMLTDIEKIVLTMTAYGKTMNEIGNEIHKSVDSIKSIKRQLFNRLGLKSSAEAIAFAISRQLII